MRRISVLAVLLFATLIASGCGQFGQRYEGESGSSTKAAASGKERPITDEKFTEAVAKRDGCDSNKATEFDIEGSQHTTDPKEKVDYGHNPPHSGNHYQIAAQWGLYDKTQADVATVHNLEHGHIVISHKGLTKAQEKQLLDQARINSFHLLVQPRAKNPKDGVFYTAWGAQLYCEKPSAAAMQYMIEKWRDQAPELFTDDAGMEDMGVSDDS
jgi:hypothetical protein